MASVKGAPFRYKGSINVEDCKTSEDVMIKSGLNWDVSKCELYGKMPGLIEDTDKEGGFLYGGDYFNVCDNAYGIYRTDHNIPLGVVKGRYTPVQNIEAFSFFDNAIGKNKAIWQTAGCFGHGEKVFVSAKLPKNILVNGNDPIDNYLVFLTSHDGSTGVKILLTPIRIVCQNTLNAAIRNNVSYISFRHTASVHKNIDIASEILGICEHKIISLNESYNMLAKKKMTDIEAQTAFGDIILTDNELTMMAMSGHNISEIVNRNWKAIQDSQISMKKVNVLASMNDYYYSGPGQQEFLGTAWGVYGAITGYYSNIDNSEGVKRMDSLLYGDKSKKIELAGNTLLSA